MALPKYLKAYVPNGSGGHKVGSVKTAGLSASQLAATMRSSLNQPRAASPQVFSPGVGTVRPGTPAPVQPGRYNPAANAERQSVLDRQHAAARQQQLQREQQLANAQRAQQGGAAPVAAQPAGPTGPRVFFDPLSSTLWRTEGGQEFALPGDTSNLQFMDGNLLNSSMAKEAGFFYNQGQGAYKLGTHLRPFERQLDQLNEKDAQGRTLFDVLSGQAQRQWQGKADGAMTSAAARGIYDSGMRENTGFDLATELSNAKRDLDTSYGSTAVANIGKQKNDARESWVSQWLGDFTNYYNTKVAGDVENELHGIATGGAGGATGTPAPINATKPAASKPAAPKPTPGIGTVRPGTPAPISPYLRVYVPNGKGGQKIGTMLRDKMTPAQLKAALASPLNK